MLLECDVLVVGAGMSGFAAAVSAARAGVQVVIADKNHYPGGVATSGLMCSMTNYLVTRDGTQVTTGLPIELLDRIVNEDGGMPGYLRAAQPQIPNDPEVVKRVMIKMLRESEVRALYGCLLIDVVLESGRIDCCVFQGRDRAFAVKATQYVDASGDLSLAGRAGGTCEERDDRTSLLNRMANVDVDRLVDWLADNPESYSPEKDIPTSLEDTIRNWREYGVFHLPHGGGVNVKVVKEAIERGEYSRAYGRHAIDLHHFGLYAARCNRGIVLINSNFFNGDCYDVIAESEREEEGRLLAEMQADFLVRNFPGFEHAYLVETASEIGHRISRTFVGSKRLAVDDFADGVRFDDVIGLVSAVDRRTRPWGFLRKAGNVPLGILTHERLPNVIVGSGKNPCVQAPGMLRGQAGCLVVGRGAGVAAAEAVRQGLAVSAAAVDRIQRELRRQGALLEV